jgi:hypothetical protein
VSPSDGNHEMSAKILSHIPRVQVFENFKTEFFELFRVGNSLVDMLNV